MFRSRPVLHNLRERIAKLVVSLALHKEALKGTVMSFHDLVWAGRCGEINEWNCFFSYRFVCLYIVFQFNPIHFGHVDVTKNEKRFVVGVL